MKATGIVRRIDDLGRIVVPKEIRRTLRIREGDPLEIFTSREGEIMLKKYSPVGELGEFARSYAQALAQTTEALVCITDREYVIGAGKCFPVYFQCYFGCAGTLCRHFATGIFMPVSAEATHEENPP